MLHHTIYKHKTIKEWVTFIHGAGGSSTIWYKQLREFSKSYNILLVDLRGHGVSGEKINIFKNEYTYKNVSNDVIEVLDHINIRKSHFIGISLGTIIIRQIAEMRSDLVDSMIMGGAIMKMNFRTQSLMTLGNLFKNIVPNLTLYKFFAFVVMPRKNHRESRILFIKEAKRVCQKEFKSWFKLIAVETNIILDSFRVKEIDIPTYYIMGEEDHLFISTVRNVVAFHRNAKLFVIEDCGHVVNIEQPEIFNKKSITFLKSLEF